MPQPPGGRAEERARREGYSIHIEEQPLRIGRRGFAIAARALPCNPGLAALIVLDREEGSERETTTSFSVYLFLAYLSLSHRHTHTHTHTELNMNGEIPAGYPVFTVEWRLKKKPTRAKYFK